MDLARLEPLTHKLHRVAHRTLERMQAKRQRILDDPAAYRAEQIAKKLPVDFDDLPEVEQQKISEELEEVVASVDPAELREDILQLGRLVDQARILERREIESKLVKLREVINDQGIFGDPKMKLLVFTEHKDTLDYLAGDGKDGRPLGKLREWGLAVTQIHGGMKIGDRDTPGTRICAEREFRDEVQVLVATEAAGEGINLQFCWLMINYDVPWNFVRLEQRMGRIHRYGQGKDCLILNFVSTNTREGRVVQKLFERLHSAEIDLDPLQTGKVYNVVGEIFPSNQLERMIRDMYAQNLTEDAIKKRIVEQVDVQRFREITDSTLEGLAKRELNLSALIGSSAEARERRLVPEVIEDFFVDAGPLASIHPKETRPDSHVYRIGRVPRTLDAIGERLEPRFGKLGREYRQIVFDKSLLAKDATSEWVTPGHPLFEAVREDVLERVHDDLQRGSVFFDLNAKAPSRLDVFSAAVRDGRGNHLHRKLFAVQLALDGTLTVKEPTIFLDLVVAPVGTAVPDGVHLPDRQAAEQTLIEKSLVPYLATVAKERERETKTILEHLEISLNELIHRQSLKMAELYEHSGGDESSPLFAANKKQVEDRLDELTGRLERRQVELRQERQCTIGDIQHVGSAWVLPHPERTSPGIAPMVRDEEIERLAVDAATAYEEARGWEVESVEDQNRGFDLISRKPHPEDSKTFVEVRFIEVKGRATVGEIALSSNEYKTAVRLKRDFWLYAVFNCASKSDLHPIQDPARLGWKPVVQIEHYHVGADQILEPPAMP